MKSFGSVSERRSPLAMAHLTKAKKAAWMSEREPSRRRTEPPVTVSIAGMMSFFSETWSMKRSIQARRASSGGMVVAKRCSAAASFSTSLR